MIYQFKIHSTDRARSTMGQVEADDMAEATAAALNAYKAANHPAVKVIELVIEEVESMNARREEWEKEAQQ